MLFFAVVLIYALLIFLGWILGAVVVKRFPENFEWQVKSALKQGNIQQAESIARKRVKEEHYDFSAHRLLAEVLLEANQPDQAVEVLLMSLERMHVAMGRPVYTRGADPATAYDLLTTALLKLNRVHFAGEVKRIATDHAQISAVDKSSQLPDTYMDYSNYFEKPVGEEISLSQFTTTGGVELTTSKTLYFSTAGTAKLDNLEITQGNAALLHMLIAGGKALGLGSILKITLGNETVSWAYGNSAQPRWVTVSLPKLNSQATVPLTVHFLNDAYDTVTGADRNIEIQQLILQQPVP